MYIPCIFRQPTNEGLTRHLKFFLRPASHLTLNKRKIRRVIEKMNYTYFEYLILASKELNICTFVKK